MRLTVFIHLLVAIITIDLVLSIACVGKQPASDTGDPGFPLGPSTTAAAPIAYVQDLQGFFQTDCVSCHSNQRRQGNYSMSSYSEVLSDVRVGDASCRLVVDTQPGGSMYRYLTGDRQLKAALVFRWVVVYGAAETR